MKRRKWKKMRNGTEKATTFVTKRARSFGVWVMVEGKDSKRDENGNTIGLWGSPFARGVASAWSLRRAILATAPFLDPALVPFYSTKKDKEKRLWSAGKLMPSTSLEPTAAQAWRMPRRDALRYSYRWRPPKETIPIFHFLIFSFYLSSFIILLLLLLIKRIWCRHTKLVSIW